MSSFIETKNDMRPAIFHTTCFPTYLIHSPCTTCNIIFSSFVWYLHVLSTENTLSQVRNATVTNTGSNSWLHTEFLYFSQSGYKKSDEGIFCTGKKTANFTYLFSIILQCSNIFVNTADFFYNSWSAVVKAVRRKYKLRKTNKEMISLFHFEIQPFTCNLCEHFV